MRCLILLLLAGLVGLGAVWCDTTAAAVVPWTSFTFENNSGLTLTSSAADQKDLNADDPSRLRSITAGGNTYSSLVFASSATVGGSALIGDDMSVGVANPATFDVSFSSSPSDVSTDFLMLTDFGSPDTFDLQLLGSGGTAIGTKLTGLSNSSWPDIADGIRYGGDTNDEVQGAIMDLSDFGSGLDATDIQGVRVFATGGGTNQKLDPLVVGLALGGAAPPPPTETIFSDPFDLDPAANGWTEAVQDGIDIDDDGGSGHARFWRPTGANGSNVEASITRTLSTVGFENIALELFGDQFSTSFEGDDYIALRYDLDDGGGFQQVFFVNDDLAGNAFDTGLLGLPPGAANQPNLTIQIAANFNAGAEGYRLDEFNLLGSPLASEVIPEPSAFFIWWLLAGLGVGLGWRRPANR